MIWYIIGAVVVLGLILFVVLGKKGGKREDIKEGEQVKDEEAKLITSEPTLEEDPETSDEESTGEEKTN